MHYNGFSSIYRENSTLTTSSKSKQSPTQSLDFDYPSSWNIDDVIKWLNNISLDAYGENFRSKKVLFE